MANNDLLSQLLFVLFIVSVIALAVGLFFYYHQLRRKAFIALAGELGLQYHYLSYGLPRRLGLVYQLHRGKNRYAANILRGNYKGFPVYIFDYHYTIGDKRSKVHYYCSIAILRHGLDLPEVRIYPPSIMEKVGRVAGFDRIEIHTENEAFSKAFTTLAGDAVFAREFCHPNMMEYMLRHLDMSVELGPEWLATCIEGRIVPEEIIRRLDQLIKICRFVPNATA